MKFDEEFKVAITDLPEKEKDKLLFRLLKKDLRLVNRLYFELLDLRTADERRLELEQKVCESVDWMSERFYSPGYLQMDMRSLSGTITEHVQITKDKFGEASLNLLMLNRVLRKNNSRISNASSTKAQKLCVYIVVKTFKILLSINKLHEDCLLDFQDGLETLAKNYSANQFLPKVAIKNGLDLTWLASANIPKNIIQIHSDLRKQGLLK